MAEIAVAQISRGVGVGIVSLSIILLSSNKIEKWNKVKASNLDERNTIVNEFLLSIREIKAFNIFEPIRNRITRSTEEIEEPVQKKSVVKDVVRNLHEKKQIKHHSK